MDFTEDKKYKYEKPTPELLSKIQRVLWKNRAQKTKKGCKTTLLTIQSEEDFINNQNYKLEFIVNSDIEKKRKLWAEQKKKYRENNREKAQLAARIYYHKNKEKILPQIYKSRKARKARKDKLK